MSLTFDQMRARFAKFMLTDDTDQPPISATDRDALLNEAYHEYLARFAPVYKAGSGVNYGYTADIPWTTFSGAVGVAADGQWIECESVEYRVSPGSVYAPLKRMGYYEIAQQQNTEGATGAAPEVYGITLEFRNLLTGQSQFQVLTYPQHSNANGRLRARIRTWGGDLVNGADVPLADGIQGDYIARIAALRGGLALGHDDQWARNLAAPLPRELKKRLDLDVYTRWSKTATPRQVGELVRGL